MKTITTNCFLLENGKLLLGLKKRGFGEGRWNGFGGKVLEGESLEESARREIQEECGLDAKKIEHVGLLHFTYQGKDKEVEVHFFKITEYSGEITESEEMKPEWFAIDSLPFEKMWPDDKYWMPLFLAGKKFIGTFLFEGYDVVLKKDIKEVENV